FRRPSPSRPAERGHREKRFPKEKIFTPQSCALVGRPDLDPRRQRLALHLAYIRERPASAAGEVQRDPRPAHAQAVQRQFADEPWKLWVDDLQRLTRRVGIEPEAGAQHEEE